MYFSFITSLNGYDWISRILPSSSGNWISICYGSNLFIAVSSTGTIIKSSDGITWSTISLSNSYNRSSVVWIDDLEIYVITSSTSSTNSLSYSYDGSTWFDITFQTSISIYSIAWSSTLKMFILNCGSGNYMTSKKLIVGVDNLIPVQDESNILFNYNQENGNLGIGVSSSSIDYQLQVNGIAAKPSTTTWIVTSDERLKENIVNADLDICYNTIKNLRLAQYKLKDFVEVDSPVKLGWIAQEVEDYIPKAVTKTDKYGIKDCRGLNSDQIIAMMYGTVQKLFDEYERESNELSDLYLNLPI